MVVEHKVVNGIFTETRRTPLSCQLGLNTFRSSTFSKKCELLAKLVCPSAALPHPSRESPMHRIPVRQIMHAPVVTIDPDAQARRRRRPDG